MKLYHKLSVLLMAGLLLVGGSMLTGGDNDDLDTNPYNRGGVNLLGFGPCPLKRLDNMRITGTQLNRVDKVLFPQGNTLLTESTTYEEAEFHLINNEEIEVVVPDQTVPGKLRLVVGNDTIVSVSKITFEETAVIENVAPIKNVCAGDVITISGEFVWNIASVTFSDYVVVEAENFLKNTRKEIQVEVPREAQSGEITFSNGADKPQIVSWPEPLEIRQTVVTGLSAEALEFGETITISGTDLNLVEKVNFPLMTEGVAFTVNADGTQLMTTVPETTISGTISLVQYSGLIAETVAYTLPMAEYVSISPTEDLKEGDAVVIAGKNLDRITSINLPGGIVLKQGEFVQSATQIQFTVPEDMGDGKVVLVQHENYSIETDKVAMHHDGAEIVIWTGPWICTGWAGNQDLAWGNFDWSTVKVGQEIIFYVEFADPTAGWACISPRVADGWGNLPSIGQIDLTPGAEVQRVVFKPTAEDLEALQTKNGLVVTGDGFILKQVALSILETVLWTGSVDLGNWANGFQDLAWSGYDWTTVSVGQKLLVYFEQDTAADFWQLKLGQGNGWNTLPDFKDCAGGADAVDIAAGNTSLDYVLGARDVATLQDGGQGLIMQGANLIIKKVAIQ